MIRKPFLPLSVVLGLTLYFVPVLSAQAQQGSDVSGALPQSDVSGALTQADPFFFEREVARNRLSEAAGTLAQALREGRKTAVVEGDALSGAPKTATLLTGDAVQDVKLARQHFVQVLTARGLPDERARSLGRTVTGLLVDGEVETRQFLRALQAYNKAVEAAPEGFRSHPPTEFLHVRAVLNTLLQSASH